MKALLFNLFAYILLLNTQTAHSVEYFIALSANTKDAFGVINIVFENEKAKVTQISYLESITSALHKEILHVLLKTDLPRKDKNPDILFANMNSFSITEFSERSLYLTFIKTIELKEIRNNAKDKWSLTVNVLQKSKSSGDVFESISEFILLPSRPGG